jgi:tetratricopeptide (TPR) repeat protein
MSIQEFLRSFRVSAGTGDRRDFTLEQEVSLYRRRAEVALGEERFDDALVFLAKVLRLNPYDLQARMTVAEVYHYGLNEATKALLTYEKVIASAGYDESNSYCVKAREAIGELTLVFDTPSIALQDLFEEDTPQTDNGGLAQSVAG